MLTLSFWGADGLMITPETLTSGMVGTKIAFQFAEDWKGLNKTAVFMAGNTIRAVSNVEDTAEIPAEVLATPGSRLYVGIYGESEDGTLVIPTICVAGPKIQYGADPLQAPAGEPPVTSYARLLTMIGDLTKLNTEAKNSLVAALNEMFTNGSNGSSADAGGNSGNDSGQNYTLPIATAETLGGVKPVTKTETMTQPVGVDANGLLYTVPGEVTGSDDLKTELNRQIIIEAVRQHNHTQNAMRIATYNIYGAGYYQSNWPRLKEQLFQYGLDICAMQEVKDPLGINAGNKKFAEEMTSTMLPHASTNGELYPTNTRSALSRYPIVSCSEFEFEKWSMDRRYLARYEIALPKFKNRIGSDNLKMSVYNTQLDFNWENIVQYELQEMLAAIAQDPNPFIAICIDSNDGSEDKQVWQTIEAAGFTRCIDGISKTVKYDSICLDQIFVNENMRSLFYDVIDSNSYTFSAAPWNNAPISDHSLCYADIELLYDNIWCVKEDLTHVTSDIPSPHIKRGEPFTAHYTVDEGYEILSVTVWMIDENRRIQDTVWDVSTGTISIPEVTNDIYVKMVAQLIANTVDYGISIPSGYTGSLDTGKNTGTVEMTVDVPSWDNKESFSLIGISFQTIMANSNNTWTVRITPGSTVDVDVAPNDLVGAGKKTVTFSNFTGFENSSIKIIPTAAMTIYELKHYKANGTLDLHLVATDVPGVMKDVLTDKNYQFSVALDGEGEGDDSEETVACTGITLSAATVELNQDETQTLTATVTPDGCTDPVTWESDNTGVATVSGGVVTAIAAGSATITATCGEYSAECAVTVNTEKQVSYSVTNKLTNVTSDKSISSVTEGSSYAATLTPDAGYELGDVVVTMGGTDITASAYADGTISIDAVTGEIVITASGTVPKSYGLKMPATNASSAKLTVRGGQIGTIVLTADIPEAPNGFQFLTCLTTWFGITQGGEWRNATSDVAASDVLGAGKKTVTLNNTLPGDQMPNDNFTFVHRDFTADHASVEVTLYNLKIYDYSGTLKNDISPTSTVGELYDSVRNLTYTFSDTTDMELVEG